MALGVDTTIQLIEAGYYRRRGLESIYLEDMPMIAEAYRAASKFI